MDEMNRMMLRLAQAYIPFQVYVNRWDPMKGLMMGTIFPELYRPYYESMRRA
ncbi:MAG: spore coat associated protein CotJA [Firmicutes bacterium]|nr:spore coat associated protein CotJA [Bacillota bacterium]